MKVLKSKRNGNTINLEVEASHEELESKFDGAFKKVKRKGVKMLDCVSLKYEISSKIFKIIIREKKDNKTKEKILE